MMSVTMDRGVRGQVDRPMSGRAQACAASAGVCVSARFAAVWHHRMWSSVRDSWSLCLSYGLGVRALVPPPKGVKGTGLPGHSPSQWQSEDRCGLRNRAVKQPRPNNNSAPG